MRMVTALLLAAWIGSCPVHAGESILPASAVETANRIIHTATNSPVIWERLTHLCDYYPRRLSGSTNLEKAIDWVLAEMKKDGLENVRGEPVEVPHWVRGVESLEATAPINYRMGVVGLGGTVATPPGGIEGEVLVVRDFEELKARAAEAKDKIVLYNVAFTKYDDVVIVRSRGAIRAAEAGAKASLIRSLTPFSMRTPHTGTMRYDPAVQKIPSAAVTAEDADWIARMTGRGEKVKLRLKLESVSNPPVTSHNVLAEIRGAEKPEEIVAISAHIDSWDVGQGAMDDGGGCLAVWEAMRVLKELGLRPRRTLRAVLYTNEENGLGGARAYARAHTNEVHALALETDEGAFRPLGFRFSGPEQRLPALKEITSLLRPIGADSLLADSGAPDLIFLREAGVPTMDLVVEQEKYFWYHHTDADTLDKLSPEDVRKCAASIAVMAWFYSNLPDLN